MGSTISPYWVFASSSPHTFYEGEMVSTSPSCDTPRVQASAWERCEYCGRTQQYPPEGTCFGCGAPKPKAAAAPSGRVTVYR